MSPRRTAWLALLVFLGCFSAAEGRGHPLFSHGSGHPLFSHGRGSTQIFYYIPMEPDCCSPCLPLCPPPAPPEIGPPVIALQLLAPAQISAGEEIEYRIIVENRSSAAAHHVTVRNPLPANARYVRANPEPALLDPELRWALGTMEPADKREIRLVLMPTGPGDIKNCARVTFEHGLCVTTTIAQPALKLQKRGPAEAWLSDPLTYELVVTNPGSGPAKNVVVLDTLPEGLDHSSGQKQLSFTIGTLAPGESKAVNYQVIAKANGRFCNRAVATADGGLRDEVEWCVNVVEAKLELIKTGPKQRYVNHTVTYKITASNPGNVPVQNLVVTDTLPPQTSFDRASDGGRQSGSQVQWSLGPLAPGASRSVELTIKAPATGEIVNRAQATGERGLRAVAEWRTEILGAAGLLLEVVDADDPVEVGADTHYNIIVRNQGTLAATNLRITATAPAEMAVIRVQGPVDHVKDGQKVTYNPINIPPNSDAVYRIFVRGTKPGDTRFRVEMTADQLPAGPVLEEESTNVYSGTPPPGVQPGSRKKQ